jgi:hypothetical protein
MVATNCHLPLGARVRILGLKSPRGRVLNQHFGIVTGWNNPHQRYSVILDDSNLTGLFLPVNLRHEERHDGITFVDLLSGDLSD